MKSVLISIQPKWCELIASGKKTVEVRKTRPKIKTPFKVYIYCTQNTPYNPVIPMRYEKEGGNIYTGGKRYSEFLTGKVIGEFVCDRIEQGHILWVKEQPEYYDKVEETTQLTYRQMFDYLGESGVGYFWHISDLKIYDKPKELGEFCTVKEIGGYEEFKRIARPPQSWCYVEELRGTEMREILFRGKRTDNDEWIKGYLHKTYGVGKGYRAYAIQVQDIDTYMCRPHSHEVQPETVGQFTGLIDKNGKKIFEGDILKGLFRFSMPVYSIVSFNDGAFGLLWYREGVETFWAFTSICNVEYEVIGNTHDNPELLEVE